MLSYVRIPIICSPRFGASMGKVYFVFDLFGTIMCPRRSFLSGKGFFQMANLITLIIAPENMPASNVIVVFILNLRKFSSI